MFRLLSETNSGDEEDKAEVGAVSSSVSNNLNFDSDRPAIAHDIPTIWLNIYFATSFPVKPVAPYTIISNFRAAMGFFRKQTRKLELELVVAKMEMVTSNAMHAYFYSSQWNGNF